MSLFSDLYNTLAKFFRAGDEQGDASKSVATNRLKLVLMQDRTNLTPKILEQMRSELIDLLSRYVELDKELLDLNFEQEGNQVALMLSIPVIRAKDEDEIEAAIKEHEKVLKAVSEQNSECESGEESGTEDCENPSDSIRTEEEQAEHDKVNAIVQEFSDVHKIIKNKEKKEVSAPEEMNNNNPFKSDNSGVNEMVESSLDN